MYVNDAHIAQRCGTLTKTNKTALCTFRENRIKSRKSCFSCFPLYVVTLWKHAHLIIRILHVYVLNSRLNQELTRQKVKYFFFFVFCTAAVQPLFFYQLKHKHNVNKIGYLSLTGSNSYMFYRFFFWGEQGGGHALASLLLNIVGMLPELVFAIPLLRQRDGILLITSIQICLKTSAVNNIQCSVLLLLPYKFMLPFCLRHLVLPL